VSELYRITVEVENDATTNGAMTELGMTLHRIALMNGRSASTNVVHVFADARTAGNVVWKSAS
jgi:hypothetical protein